MHNIHTHARARTVHRNVLAEKKESTGIQGDCTTSIRISHGYKGHSLCFRPVPHSTLPDTRRGEESVLAGRSNGYTYARDLRESRRPRHTQVTTPSLLECSMLDARNARCTVLRRFSPSPAPDTLSPLAARAHHLVGPGKLHEFASLRVVRLLVVRINWSNGFSATEFLILRVFARCSFCSCCCLLGKETIDTYNFIFPASFFGRKMFRKAW